MKATYILFFLFVVLHSSCTDQLDLVPPSSATTIVFYKNESDFQQALNAVYADLKTYPTRVLDLSETRSDNIYGVSDDGKRYWDEINNFSSALAANSKVLAAWSENFSGIFKANTLLDQLELHGDEVLTEALRMRLEAEGRYLRAFYYFDMVRHFGAVPLMDRVHTASEAEAVPRSSVEEVYELIMSDLDYATQHLPESYPANGRGRATVYAAKGLLALIHMTRSGPTYDVAGAGLGVNEWAEAAALLDDIITSNRYRMQEEYSRIFAYDNENNSEVIFDVQYISGGLGLGGEFPSLFLPDQYVQQIAGFAGGVMVRPPSADLLQSYPEGDLRVPFSVRFGYTDGGRFDPRPLLVKFVDASRRGTRWTDWPLNYIVLRYTDVLLLRAECTLHGAAASAASPLEVVNLVRERAGISPLSSVNLDDLYAERRREFLGEGLRWHDLIRSGKVVTTMNSWADREDAQHAINPMKAEFILYPVPQSELNIVPGLYDQNEGYN